LSTLHLFPYTTLFRALLISASWVISFMVMFLKSFSSESLIKACILDFLVLITRKSDFDCSIRLPHFLPTLIYKCWIFNIYYNLLVLIIHITTYYKCISI